MEKEMTHIEQQGDAVTNGIREWQKVRDSAKEAIERCRKAEEEVSYTRGEQAAIKQRCEGLEARNRQLMEENAEYKMLLSDLGQRFLEVLQNSKLSPFRAPGSINAEKIASRTDTGSPPPTPLTTTSASVDIEHMEAGISNLAKHVAARRANLAAEKV